MVLLVYQNLQMNSINDYRSLRTSKEQLARPIRAKVTIVSRHSRSVWLVLEAIIMNIKERTKMYAVN